MKTSFRVALLVIMVTMAGGVQWCKDGVALQDDEQFSWENCKGDKTKPSVATIAVYEQEWELVSEGIGNDARYFVDAKTTIGFRVTSGQAKVAYKSLFTDVSGWTYTGSGWEEPTRAISTSEVVVIGQNGETLSSALDTHIDKNGESVRLVKFDFPGNGITPQDGVYTVQISYRMEQAACKGDGIEEFSAPWANTLVVAPEGTIRYSFTLPAEGVWRDEDGQQSPWIHNPSPSSFASSPKYDQPPGQGPRVSVSFVASELGIGSSPSDMVFRWRRDSGEDTDDLPRCAGSSDSSTDDTFRTVAVVSAIVGTFVLGVAAYAIIRMRRNATSVSRVIIVTGNKSASKPVDIVVVKDDPSC